MKRRTVVGAVGGLTAGVAGCLTRDGDPEEPADDDEEPDDPDLDTTLRVATDAELLERGDAVAEWLRDAFEEAYPDADLEWTIPETGLEHYVRRARQDAPIDADVYVGLEIPDLATVDDDIEDGALFRELNVDRIDRRDRLRDGLDAGDPHGRFLPVATEYVSLRYDESRTEPPDSFDTLLEPNAEDALLVPDPHTTETGGAFLLWTILARGDDDYREYWEALADNGVAIREEPANEDAVADEGRPIVVARSSDRVVATETSQQLEGRPVAFPDGQGYATPTGAALFEHAEALDLAYAFVDFLLSSDVQAALAERGVGRPVVDDEHVTLPDELAADVEPPEAVTMPYDRRRDGLEEWLAGWAQAVDA